MDRKALTEVAITGGPCAGKTSALSYLSEKLRDRGYRVFVTPEVATTMVTGGLAELAELPQRDPAAYYRSQKEFVLLQRDLRARFQGLAACFPQERCVILHDRAEMDTASYMRPEEWQALLAELRLGLADVRDSYDAVVHMVTVARDAPELYTLETNAARQETDVAQAVAADEATLRSWLGHPHLRIVDNSTDFASKLRRALGAVLRAVGEPVPTSQERKFLLSAPPTSDELKARGARQSFIEQTYLLSSDPQREIRLRRRVEEGHVSYSRTEKVILPGTRLRQEKEEIIAPSAYLRLLESRDPARRTLAKTRYCFTEGFTYCELDVFAAADPLSGVSVLEVEQAEGERLELPELAIVREVTDDPEYANAQLAELTTPPAR